MDTSMSTDTSTDGIIYMYGIGSSFAKFDVLFFFAGILFCNKSEFLNWASHKELERCVFNSTKGGALAMDYIL